MSNDGISDVLFVLGLILGLLLIGLMGVSHINFDPGKGQQTGYISEVQNSGLIWQPVSITLIGSEPTFSAGQTSYNYGAISPEIAKTAKEYLKTHQKVSVEYDTVVMVWSWDYSSACRIVNISPLES